MSALAPPGRRRTGAYTYIAARGAVSEDERAEVRAIFHDFDGNGKGYLLEEELEAALLSFLGFQPSRVELDAYARDHMEDIAHLYDWKPRLGSSQPDGGRPPVVLGMAQHTFVDLVCDKMMLMDPDEEVRETFLKFDVSGNGFLTFEDVARVFASVAPFVPNTAIEACFNEADLDADGKLSYREFEAMMKYESAEATAAVNGAAT